ncbi:MAG: hypothetical protein IJL38_07650 [Bacteroidales bacterium]|nr:hypothetical protein [Bacteroidales bacterium]
MQKKTNPTLRFLCKWWKVMVIALTIGVVGSTVTAFLIKPMYKSTAVFLPTSSNRMTKAILGDRYTYDFLDYGDEENCEYAIQVLSSQTMRDTVCSRFNLLTHYAISPDDPHKLYKLNKNYKGNVTVRRTDYLGVEVSVMDCDPQWAADIANFIVTYYDTLCTRVQHERACDAHELLVSTGNALQEEIACLEDSLSRNAHQQASLKDLITEECGRLALIKSYEAVTKADMETPVCHRFMLDKASVSDKKAYPKRIAIIAAGTLGALLLCIAVLVVLEYVKNEDLRIKED